MGLGSMQCRKECNSLRVGCGEATESRSSFMFIFLSFISTGVFGGGRETCVEEN